jgi:AcrR family transcriptional regulator
MTPRTYTQEKRAASAAETKRRIRDAALALYREQGIRTTTIAAVAKRSDVSRGTVLNHFANADGLLNAVLDDIVDRLGYPDYGVLAEVADEAERIRRYVEEMFRFFVRSEDDWPAFYRELDHPILKAREAAYYEIAGRLYQAAFGDLASDRLVQAAVRAFVTYAPLYELRAAGLTVDESIGLVAQSLIDLVERRRRPAQRKGGS